MSCVRRWRWSLGVVLGIALFGGPAARTQEVTEPSLKAAYLLNFARFTTWGADALPPAAKLSACVLNDESVRDALARHVRGQLLSGREVDVLRVQADGSLRSCHLLYLSALSQAQFAAVVKGIGGAPVLTVSELDGFARKGGIVHIFVQNGKIKFNIDNGLARRSALELSSRLLALAENVYEAPAGGKP